MREALEAGGADLLAKARCVRGMLQVRDRGNHVAESLRPALRAAPRCSRACGPPGPRNHRRAPSCRARRCSRSRRRGARPCSSRRSSFRGRSRHRTAALRSAWARSSRSARAGAPPSRRTRRGTDRVSRKPARRRCQCWPEPDRSLARGRIHAVPDSGPRSRGRCRACGSTCAPRRETPSRPAAAALRRGRTCRASVRRRFHQARTARQHGTGPHLRRGTAGRAHGRTRHSRRRAWRRPARSAPARSSGGRHAPRPRGKRARSTGVARSRSWLACDSSSPCSASTRSRASRTDSTLAGRFRRKTVSETTDPKPAALGFEHAEDRAIDRFGLQVRLRRFSGRLAVKEEFRSLGTFDPTQNDRTAVCFDRLGNGMRRHFSPCAATGAGFMLAQYPRSAQPAVNQ